MTAAAKFRTVLALSLLFFLVSAPQRKAGQAAATRTKTYALNTGSNEMCRAKGRFQDRDHCGSAVIDRIVADGKPAIPILISQLTDARWIAEPVYDYWLRIRTGELAYFILGDLFLDDTWQKGPMLPLFPEQHCDDAAPVCGGNFRKTHTLRQLQARWMEFCKANRDKVYWDEKARCFRLSAAKIASSEQ
jgi:hypothetical protein